MRGGRREEGVPGGERGLARSMLEGRGESLGSGRKRIPEGDWHASMLVGGENL